MNDARKSFFTIEDNIPPQVPRLWTLPERPFCTGKVPRISGKEDLVAMGAHRASGVDKSHVRVMSALREA
jgi:hypothetical protein